ncbi:MAG: hypothetical protein ACMG6E_06590 [Candidatus Roizmanbacteria bacterium]
MAKLPDSVKDYGKNINIFSYNKPEEEHFLVLEVLGIPQGKTF